MRHGMRLRQTHTHTAYVRTFTAKERPEREPWDREEERETERERAKEGDDEESRRSKGERDVVGT